jgi:hypothetical protein
VDGEAVVFIAEVGEFGIGLGVAVSCLLCLEMGEGEECGEFLH